MSRIGCLVTLHHRFHKTNRRNLLSLINNRLLVVGVKLTSREDDDMPGVFIIKWYNRDYKAVIAIRYGQQYVRVTVGSVTIIINYYDYMRQIEYRIISARRKAVICFTRTHNDNIIAVLVKRVENILTPIYYTQVTTENITWFEMMQSETPIVTMMTHIDEITCYLLKMYTDDLKKL